MFESFGLENACEDRSVTPCLRKLSSDFWPSKDKGSILHQNHAVPDLLRFRANNDQTAATLTGVQGSRGDKARRCASDGRSLQKRPKHLDILNLDTTESSLRLDCSGLQCGTTPGTYKTNSAAGKDLLYQLTT